jgi:transcriptional regulator with GAF, ATPase, and Fis domain
VSPIVAWLVSLLRGDGGVTAEIADALAAAGVELALAGAEAGDGPGVVLVGAVSAETAEAVRALSRYGQRRVLALVGADELPAGEVWRLLALGAADVLAWSGPPVAVDVAARLRRWIQVDELVDTPQVRGQLIGQSSSWRATLRRVVEVARFTSASVLLTGESGTGKELVARLVHDLDPRPAKGELVVVDCTTVVPTLSGSEFFGHERGAFTGAVAARDGAFALANRGTLFLDEVGELPAELQSELLRVVQEGTYKRVGSNAWQTTAFRLICATNRDLAEEQAAGRFRRDFYYRIAAATMRLPPLRERMADTLPLFAHFLAELCPGRQVPGLDPVVRELLLRRDYPGNVRDLRQLALRVSNRHVGAGPITAGDIPEEDRPAAAAPASGFAGFELDEPVRQGLANGKGLRELREAAADAAVRVALEEAGGNLRQAAARLGVTDRALQLRRAGWRDGRQPARQPALSAADGRDGQGG